MGLGFAAPGAAPAPPSPAAAAASPAAAAAAAAVRAARGCRCSRSSGRACGGRPCSRSGSGSLPTRPRDGGCGHRRTASFIEVSPPSHHSGMPPPRQVRVVFTSNRVLHRGIPPSHHSGIPPPSPYPSPAGGRGLRRLRRWPTCRRTVKGASCRGRSRPPRAPPIASEGVRRLYTPRRRGLAPSIQPRGRGLSSSGCPRRHLRCV